METISNVVSAASRAVWGEGQSEANKQQTEPVSGVTGAGKPMEPYDGGNAEENQTPHEAATSGQTESGSRHDQPSTQGPDAADDASHNRDLPTNASVDSDHPLHSKSQVEAGQGSTAADVGELGSSRAAETSGSQPQEDRHGYPSNIGQKTLQLQRNGRDEPVPQETSDSLANKGDLDGGRNTDIVGTPSQTQDDKTARPLASSGDDSSIKVSGDGDVGGKPSGLGEDRGAPGFIAGTPVKIADGGLNDSATSQDINSGQQTLDDRAASDLGPKTEAGPGDTSYIAGTPFQTQLGQPDTPAASHDPGSVLPSSAPRDAGDLSQPQQPSGGLIASDQVTASDDRGSAPSDALTAALSNRTYNVPSVEQIVSQDDGSVGASIPGTSTGGLASAQRLVGQEDNKYGPSGGIAQGGQPQGVNVAGSVRPEHQTDKTGVTGLHSNDPKFSVVEPSSSNERAPVPVGGFGAVEPSVGADPTSGQQPAPQLQQQGAERPMAEPSAGESLLAVREGKELDERAADAGGSGSSQGYTGTGYSTGGEHAYRSTGFAADGGDFDATKARAPEEADRIIQQQGGLPHYPERSTHSLTGHGLHGSGHGSDHDKTGLGTKLKEKLHISH